MVSVTNRDIEKLREHLQEWVGGRVSFNAFHDDHDRLTLRLEHPSGVKEPVGLSLFYCTYVTGLVRWTDSHLEPSLWVQPDGVTGLQLADKKSGFVVRCAAATLYGQPEITIPQS